MVRLAETYIYYISKKIPLLCEINFSADSHENKGKTRGFLEDAIRSRKGYLQIKD